MRKYMTEFIGTFVLVFTVGCAVLSDPTLAPLAYGAMLMVLVYAGWHISGAHYNPAISLGVYLRGKLEARDLLSYWVAQLGGALIAAWLASYVVNAPKVSTLLLRSGHAKFGALLAEFLFTFVLVYVVLNVVTSKDQPNNQFFGLAIGFAMAAGVVAAGKISGGALNPAIAFGASIIGLLNWSNIWIYLIAELLAGAVAAFTFRYLNPDDARSGPLAHLPKISVTRSAG